MIISFHRQWLYYNLLRHSGNRHDMLGWYYRVLEFNFLAFVIYSFICFYYYCFKIISIIRTVLWFDSIFYISAFWHKLTKSWISHYKILHILDGFLIFLCVVWLSSKVQVCAYRCGWYHYISLVHCQRQKASMRWWWRVSVFESALSC